VSSLLWSAAAQRFAAPAPKSVVAAQLCGVEAPPLSMESKRAAIPGALSHAEPAQAAPK